MSIWIERRSGRGLWKGENGRLIIYYDKEIPDLSPSLRSCPKLSPYFRKLTFWYISLRLIVLSVNVENSCYILSASRIRYFPNLVESLSLPSFHFKLRDIKYSDQGQFSSIHLRI